jgi:phosphoglycolate phosphatase-like HAD superfamily hydrolase
MHTKRLILFDHDKTINDSSPLEYESMLYATNRALSVIGTNLENISINLKEVLDRTAGTTEKNLVKSLTFECKIPYQRYSAFEKAFYIGRAEWYKENLVRIKEPYYKDAKALISTLKKDPQNIVGLITGNPKIVFNNRNTGYVLQNFSKFGEDIIGAFGEEALTRDELLKLAIKRAETTYGFKPTYDYLNFATNIWYIADTKKDMYSALYSGIRFIWIPTREIGLAMDLRFCDNIRFLDTYLEDRLTVTHSLDSDEAKSLFLTKELV